MIQVFEGDGVDPSKSIRPTMARGFRESYTVRSQGTVSHYDTIDDALSYVGAALVHAGLTPVQVIVEMSKLRKDLGVMVKPGYAFTAVCGGYAVTKSCDLLTAT